MIDQILRDSSLRVFHVDRDCYVVFIGIRATARRSFLRIGNTTQLPQAVHQYIEGLVCTHFPLGSAVAEREMLTGLTQRERPYLAGLPEVLKRYKNFFAFKTIFATKYQRLQRAAVPEQAEGSGAFLYYLDLDQIEITLNSERIFSLRKRAANDVHFAQRNARIAQLVSQYSSAYGFENMPRSGFFVLNSALYICERGAIFPVNPPSNCYEQLAQHGFDARRISSGAHFQLDQSFLSIIMNDALRTPPSHWHFRDIDGTITPADLTRFLRFAQKNISTKLLQESETIPFSAFTLELLSNTSYRLRLDRQRYCDIDTKQGVWRVVDGHSWSGRVVPNIPYSFSLSKALNSQELARRYLPHTFRIGADKITPSEALLLNRCLDFIHAQTAKGLKTQYTYIKRASRGIGHSAQQLTLYALYNIIAILKLQIAEYTAEVEWIAYFRKACQHLAKLARQLSLHAKPTLYPSTQVIIHALRSGGYEQFIHCIWDRDSHYLEHESSIQQQIAAIIDGAGEEFHRAERSRLIRLLADLDRDGEDIHALIKDELEQKKQQDRQAARAELASASAAARRKVARGGIPPRMRRVIVWGVVLVAAVVAILLLLVDSDSRQLQRRAAQEREIVAADATDAADTADATGSADTAGATGSADTAGATDAATRDALAARISNSRLDEGSFTVLLNPGATLLSDVYLTIRSPIGEVQVTIAEIIRVVNIIARQNGFREIGAEDITTGNDPDLIYPVDQLSLPPHNDKYSIVKDDSIWVVAVSLIESQIKDFLSQLIAIDAIIDEGEAQDQERQQLLRTSIATIITQSYSASLTEIANTVEQRL